VRLIEICEAVKDIDPGMLASEANRAHLVAPSGLRAEKAVMRTSA